MSDLEVLYENLVKEKNLDYDESQHNALKVLNNLKTYILKSLSTKKIRTLFGKLIFLKHFQQKSFFHNGIYLYGGVGTGKTMIMNLFFQNLNITEKQRVHFHEFMHDFHQKTKKIRTKKNKDPIKTICSEIAKDIKVLCFDEFQIVDITDAMIVGRLFDELIKKKVTIITTSNFKPRELYGEGLNRELFIPFIELIENKLKILEVDNKVDYRKKKLIIESRFFLKNKKNELTRFDELWEKLYEDNDNSFVINYQSRELKLNKFSNGICRISFKELCENPLSTADYLNLCNYVKVLFLENIPEISKSQNDLARRFINLIDIIYEGKVQLICLSSMKIDDIYNGTKLKKEFKRTISRLNEMQTNDWIN